MFGFAKLSKIEEAKLNLWLEYDVEACEDFETFEEFLESEIEFYVTDLEADENDFGLMVRRQALAEWQA